MNDRKLPNKNKNDEYQALITGSIDELNSSEEFLGTDLAKSEQQSNSNFSIKHPLVAILLVILVFSVAMNVYYYLKSFDELVSLEQADALLVQDLGLLGVEDARRQVFLRLLQELAQGHYKTGSTKSDKINSALVSELANELNLFTENNVTENDVVKTDVIEMEANE